MTEKTAASSFWANFDARDAICLIATALVAVGAGMFHVGYGLMAAGGMLILPNLFDWIAAVVAVWKGGK